MRRSRFQLITTTCKRCDKPIVTGSRSLYGMDSLKAKYDRVCSSCMSDEEKAEMDNAFRLGMPQAIARGL